MTDHTIKKPSVYISHATSDGEFANAVKAEIERVFADGVSVFCTSSPGAISVGTDWLNDIENKLNSTQAVVVIVTPVSIERPWLWFEIGATWSKGRSGDCHIYPLCAPEIKLSELPSPLDRLQALSMSKAQDLKILFEALIKQFGFGKISSFVASNISKRIPKYKTVRLAETDLEEVSFYSGKYTGYSDEELMEVIDTHLFYPDQRRYSESIYANREQIIHLGKLIHFQEVDRSLDLPRGTARNLMNAVAKRYHLAPVHQTQNTVRYKKIERYD